MESITFDFPLPLGPTIDVKHCGVCVCVRIRDNRRVGVEEIEIRENLQEMAGRGQQLNDLKGTEMERRVERRENTWGRG